MCVEHFSHVMHLGSTVVGDLREDKDAVDAVDAILPAGTLSGAPKFRACQIIEELEHSKRGIYGGAIGYLDFTGNLDTCIAIRLVYKKKGEICIRSGGDEYVVIGKNYSDEKVERYMSRFQEFIDSANEYLNKPYTIGASLGYYMGVPDEKHTVENYLKIADDRMYENNKKRKAKSHPGIEVR